jgi:hypothetical protein
MKMKKAYSYVVLVLSLGMPILSTSKAFAEATPTPTPSSSTAICFPSDSMSPPSAEVIRLYYIRDAKSFLAILNGILTSCTTKPLLTEKDENELVIYGTPEQKLAVKRIITVLDLPRERVNMAMWGLLISSRNPQKLTKAMREINNEIAQTQRLLQETYNALRGYAEAVTIDKAYIDLFRDDLEYREIFNNTRRLSMTDILVRLNGAANPEDNYKGAVANLCRLFYEKPEFRTYIEDFNRHQSQGQNYRQPFSNFFSTLGITVKRNRDNPQNCDNLQVEIDPNMRLRTFQRRRAIINFAFQYSIWIRYSKNQILQKYFDPDALQASAEDLSTELNPTVAAINRDIEELFMQPTLRRIQKIVRQHRGVEYAEVGRTTVAGLNGLKSEVTANTASVFTEVRPLTLSDLLRNARTEGGNLNLPATGQPSPLPLPLGEVFIGNLKIPTTSLIALISALGYDRTTWRELGSGINLMMTPSVLRNSASAELDINFTQGLDDEDAKNGTQDKDSRLRPLSRIKSNTVKTKVYVDTLDIFALSTFNLDTTIDGGRSYFPIVGTIWKGIFGDIPGLGNLFSWQNSPKTIQHQSIILTNTFIVPTPMGLAPLYSQGSSKIINPDLQKISIDRYFADLYQRSPNLRPDSKYQ